MYFLNLRRYSWNHFYSSYFIIVIIFTQNSLQTHDFPSSSLLQNSQQKTLQHLPETKFSYNEYSEYTDTEDGDKGQQASQVSQWSQLPDGDISLTQSTFSPILSPGEPNASITWDDKWPSKDIKFGQLSAVSIDPDNNVVVFHRGGRIWGMGTFDINNKFDREEGPIRENTILIIDNAGNIIGEWGKNMFYLPHGLTIDHLGNYWVTDVAMHQVFKFDYKDVEEELRIWNNKNKNNNYLKSSSNFIIKPSLSLGEPFEPGNDVNRFCKPTAVAVERNGDFFVSDGYCNSRIIKFNKNGERILSWGRKWDFQENLSALPIPVNAFFVPHGLALAEEFDYIFIADRENGRILCFHSNNGTFHKEYKHRVIGSRIFSIAYNREKIYAVNGPEFLTNNNNKKAHVRGFVIDIHTGALQSQFAPGKDMQNPHDIAVSNDGKSIYIVELNPYKVHKFSQETNWTLSVIQNNGEKIQEFHLSTKKTNISKTLSPSSTLIDNTNLLNPIIEDGKMKITNETKTKTIISLVTLLIILASLCVAVAAIYARCKKRGCLLLTARRSGMRWESADRRENFKLSNLLESRKCKLGGGSGSAGRKFFDKRPNTKDFSKLNTEPETSDDDNNLTKMI